MRQLVLPVPPDRNGLVILESREYRYLVQVLRTAAGDVLEVRLPDGSLRSMLVASVDRKQKTVTLSSVGALAQSGADDTARAAEIPVSPGVSMPPPASLPPDFPRMVLFQWVLKGPKMDQVIRQATETGVVLIVPVAGDRCLSRDADAVGSGKTERWDRIVREARQQSGSPIPTRVAEPVSVADVPALWRGLSAGSTAAALVFTEAPLARKSLHEYLVNGVGLAALAIGPEGGMSARELDLLASAGFSSVHFRTNILRAETAAIYALAAVQCALTESEKWQLKESNS